LEYYKAYFMIVFFKFFKFLFLLLLLFIIEIKKNNLLLTINKKAVIKLDYY